MPVKLDSIRTVRCRLFYLFSCILFLTLVLEAESRCPFTYTHQLLQNECDFSRWLPWNCTCCGSDTSTYYLAMRQRGICCRPREPVKECLVRCNYTVNDDTDYGQCGIACPDRTKPSPCSYVKTTTTTTTASTTTTTVLLTTTDRSTTTKPTTPATQLTTIVTPTTTSSPTSLTRRPTTSYATAKAVSSATTRTSSKPTATVSTTTTSTIKTPSPMTSAKTTLSATTRTKTNIPPTTQKTTQTTMNRATNRANPATTNHFTESRTTVEASITSFPPTNHTSIDTSSRNVTMRFTKNTIPILVGATAGCVVAACIRTCCIICLCKKKNKKEKEKRVRLRKLSYHVGEQTCRLSTMPSKPRIKFV